jgi:hypothetical protein
MVDRAPPVAATRTGRRTGNSTIPEYTKMDSTGTIRTRLKKDQILLTIEENPSIKIYEIPTTKPNPNCIFSTASHSAAKLIFSRTIRPKKCATHISSSNLPFFVVARIRQPFVGTMRESNKA